MNVYLRVPSGVSAFHMAPCWMPVIQPVIEKMSCPTRTSQKCRLASFTL